jgi:hypothetical protein
VDVSYVNGYGNGEGEGEITGMAAAWVRVVAEKRPAMRSLSCILKIIELRIEL